MSTVGKAIQSLETIGNEVSLSIIHFLKSHSEASFSCLLVETGLSAIQLESYLQFLSKNDILEVRGFAAEKRYTLNQYKLLRMQFLVKELITDAVKIS